MPPALAAVLLEAVASPEIAPSLPPGAAQVVAIVSGMLAGAVVLLRYLDDRAAARREERRAVRLEEQAAATATQHAAPAPAGGVDTIKLLETLGDLRDSVRAIERQGERTHLRINDQISALHTAAAASSSHATGLDNLSRTVATIDGRLAQVATSVEVIRAQAQADPGTRSKRT